MQKQASGYLDGQFKLFHIKDRINKQFDFHYHEFNKIIIFLKGNVTYFIEGKAYYLKPWDILLVKHHDIHKPVIDASEEYERIIMWIDNDFVLSHNDASSDLTQCFDMAGEKSLNLIRLDGNVQSSLKGIISEMEKASDSEEFGSSILVNALFLQFMVYINRIFMGEEYNPMGEVIKSDRQIEEIINYINENLEEDLSVQQLSDRFFISKYYLMHKFKEETGLTIHNYISQKRLMLSLKLIKEGMPIIKASQSCGYTDYSSYLRAFKKLFKKSPRQMQGSEFKD